MNLTQHNRSAYWEPVEDQLKDIFYTIIYLPILRLLEEYSSQVNPNVLFNASNTALIQALRSGRVQYQDGTFSGEFSSSLSRILRSIGAKWNKRLSTYFLTPSRVPDWIKAEAGAYRVSAKEAHERVKKTLHQIQDQLDKAVEENQVTAQKPLKEMEKDFTPIARNLEVSPTLTPESQANLQESYSNDMKKYVKEHVTYMTDDMFNIVQRNAQQGYRFDSLVRGIKNRYDVSANKAKFLARQQSALFMSKFRQQRFSEAGIRTYKWSTSRDERVRDDHKKLNGKVYSYDSPPITDSLTGRRANPGEDFNCRCIDIPILKSIAQEAA